MRQRSPPKWTLVAYRLIWTWCPREFRLRYAPEAIDGLERLMADARATGGRRASAAVWLRAMADAAATVRRERATMRPPRWRGVGDDLRFAVRSTRRRPGFTLAIVSTLALGVGALGAVFRFADPMLFTPLPYPHADRVVLVTVRGDGLPSGFFGGFPNAADFLRVRETSQTLEFVSTFDSGPRGFFENRPETLGGLRVSPDFLRLFGADPILGRGFLTGEHQADAAMRPRVALISWALWRSAFGGRADVIGARLRLSGDAVRVGRGAPAYGVVLDDMEVIGVLPPDFVFPQTGLSPPAFLVPGDVDPRWAGVRSRGVPILARLRSGVTPDRVAAELTPMLRHAEALHPAIPRGRTVDAKSLQEELFRDVRVPLLLLFATTAAILLLGYVNLAHLTMATMAARRRELAVRQSLGASPWRLLRMHVVEVMWLGGMAGIASIAVAEGLYRAAMAGTPEFAYVYRAIPGGLDVRDVMFSAGLAVFGLATVTMGPAWQLSREGSARILQPGTTDRRRWWPSRQAWMIGLQSAFAVAVVSASVLTVRSFSTLVFQGRGFEPARMRLVPIRLPPAEASDPSRALALHARLADALSQVDGIAGAAVAASVPGMGLSGGALFESPSGPEIQSLWSHRVSGSFLRVAGMRLDAGRMFDDREAFLGARVVVVDRRTADRLWPGANPLGHRLYDRARQPYDVIGVVATVSQAFRRDAAQPLLALLPLSLEESRRIVLVARVDREPAFASIQAALNAVDDRVTVGTLQPHETYERTMGQPRFLAAVGGSLGVLAALLAATGVLAVVSHSVVRRIREIGIRVALGERRGAVRNRFMRQAIIPAAAGIAVGLVAAVWWAKALDAILVGVSSRDVWSFALAAIATLTVVALGSAWPAIRASRVDPVVTLRFE